MVFLEAGNREQVLRWPLPRVCWVNIFSLDLSFISIFSSVPCLFGYCLKSRIWQKECVLEIGRAPPPASLVRPHQFTSCRQTHSVVGRTLSPRKLCPGPNPQYLRL